MKTSNGKYVAPQLVEGTLGKGSLHRADRHRRRRPPLRPLGADGPLLRVAGGVCSLHQPAVPQCKTGAAAPPKVVESLRHGLLTCKKSWPVSEQVKKFTLLRRAPSPWSSGRSPHHEVAPQDHRVQIPERDRGHVQPCLSVQPMADPHLVSVKAAHGAALPSACHSGSFDLRAAPAARWDGPAWILCPLRARGLLHLLPIAAGDRSGRRSWSPRLDLGYQPQRALVLWCCRHSWYRALYAGHIALGRVALCSSRGSQVTVLVL